MKKITFIISFIIGFLITPNIFSQTYNLVWEDDFNGTTLDSSIWNVEQRVGVWNTGTNAELEHYTKDNVTVGDDGNGNNCLILTAKKEDYKGYGFTSGRVNTKGKFSFRYGKLVARIKMPDLANGLWPAFWTLGYTPLPWPDCGETDILEMGHSAGIAAGTPNKYIGSACHWEYNGSHAMYGTNNTAPVDLNNDYHIYTLVWTNNKIETCLDNAVTPYFTMAVSNDDMEEYTDYPQYLLFNLAVGGSLTGITNATGITAPLPGSMYIDYIKLYQQTGVGDLVDSANAIFGTFGVYEETVNVDMNLDIGFDAFIDTSGLTKRNGETPKEGDSVLSYNVTGGKGFNVSVYSDVTRDMENYATGSVQFWFKSESGDSIMVGVADSLGNEAFITLKDSVGNNPARDGQWQFAWISLTQLAGKIDLTKMKRMFILKGNFQYDGYISIDRVIWSQNDYVANTASYYGIFAEHDSIKSMLDFNSGGHIYTWSGFSAGSSTPFYGKDVLSYKPGTTTWNGFGIQSDNAIDLSAYIDGSMHFAYKTNSTGDIEIGFKNSANVGWKHIFTGSNELVRDSKWHTYSIKLKDFTPDAGTLTTNDLKDITVAFYLVGSVEISIDEIYLSKNGVALEYPALSSVNDKVENTDNLSIFPNPAHFLLNISGMENESEVAVYDLTGRLVLKEVLSGAGQLNISGLNNGLYQIAVINANKIRIFHIVKN